MAKRPVAEFKMVWGNAYVCAGCGYAFRKGYRWRRGRVNLCNLTQRCKPWTWQPKTPDSRTVAPEK